MRRTKGAPPSACASPEVRGALARGAAHVLEASMSRARRRCLSNRRAAPLYSRSDRAARRPAAAGGCVDLIRSIPTIHRAPESSSGTRQPLDGEADELLDDPLEAHRRDSRRAETEPPNNNVQGARLQRNISTRCLREGFASIAESRQPESRLLRAPRHALTRPGQTTLRRQQRQHDRAADRTATQPAPQPSTGTQRASARVCSSPSHCGQSSRQPRRHHPTPKRVRRVWWPGRAGGQVASAVAH